MQAMVGMKPSRSHQKCLKMTFIHWLMVDNYANNTTTPFCLTFGIHLSFLSLLLSFSKKFLSTFQNRVTLLLLLQLHLLLLQLNQNRVTLQVTSSTFSNFFCNTSSSTTTFWFSFSITQIIYFFL
jgi:hypothetical protein